MSGYILVYFIPDHFLFDVIFWLCYCHVGITVYVVFAAAYFEQVFFEKKVFNLSEPSWLNTD